MKLSPFNRPTSMDKELLASVIEEGDIVIDATCGNGYDTFFLAEKVGDSGKVYAFDVQSSAIETTNKRLYDNGLSDRVKLVNQGHENIKEIVDEQVTCIMFNLGYLPGSDKKVVTQPKSTIQAIEHGLDLLEPSGLMTIVVYPGHETGNKEAVSVEQFISTISQEMFDVRKINILNYRNNPPYLIGIHKKEAKK
ncbi:class I SAM-dependent methyltransferase [Natranaerobius trueperi]|uniref:SAM-dependent methyltransferase n=1 Tax=Natranaerobius trueperi TaxID=759412 RepID=A0A226C0F1_9FIRM|nr:class I SAM-dependent methyltransferase [Natranaerobius trueperi]OWZ84522.1 SAM-dependent methyltransferase [Natranaerobius trueperi]